jgi:hypothetical protein
MTPEQKANNLCMKFLIQTTTDIPYGINKAIAKECALIAVDEILKYCTREADEYFKEVKQEIEKL